MNSKQVLVILIPGFPKDEEDSTCLPAQQRFIRGINQYHPDLEIVILSFQYPYTSSTYNWHGNKVIAFGGKNKGGLYRRLLWRKVRQSLDHLHRHKNITGILSYWAGECSLAGKRWTQKNNKPFFCWVMGQDANATNRYFQRAQLQGKEIIAISDAVAERTRQHHHTSPAHVVPIGLDPDWIPSGTYRKDIAIVCAGSLIPLKQYELCIPLMSEIVKYIPHARMIIAGKGPGEEKLITLIRESGLDSHILLAGEKSHADTLELMCRARVFLHPSSTEGFSMACLEALAAGAEVVSFLQPMNDPIYKWHVVSSAQEMATKVISILQRTNDPQGVYPYPLRQTVNQVMELFGIKAFEDSKQLLRCSVG